MADVELVAVIDARDDLLKVVQRFVLVQAAAADKVVKQFAAFDVFEDEVAVPRTSAGCICAKKPQGGRTHSSLPVSQTSYKLMTLGCSMSFMMTISLSIPSSILSALAPASVMLIRLLNSMCLGTILTAAYLPVLLCLAILTRPDEPLPMVLPMRHGPMVLGSSFSERGPVRFRGPAVGRAGSVLRWRGGEAAEEGLGGAAEAMTIVLRSGSKNDGGAGASVPWRCKSPVLNERGFREVVRVSARSPCISWVRPGVQAAGRRLTCKQTIRDPPVGRPLPSEAAAPQGKTEEGENGEPSDGRRGSF